VNVTVAEGVPAVAELTVAVSVTACPKTAGFADDESDVAVVAFTTCTTLPLLAAKFAGAL
jgi:hypothetical protein